MSGSGSDDVRGVRHPDTLAVGYGYDPQDAFGAVKPPIVLTSTFAYPSAAAAKQAHRDYFDGAAPGREAGFIYARLDHPGLALLEKRFAALDGAEEAAAFASGMAAISAVLLAHLKPGDSVLHTRPLYGGTHGLLHGPLAGLGITAVAIGDGVDDASVAQAVETASAHGPVGLIFVETPANPTNGIADIALIARAADALAARQGGRRPVVVVDNTFLGSLLQAPLAHGADLSMTSLTKYAGGHSDLIGGAVSGPAALIGPLRRLRTLLGTHLDPFTSWLALRSLETFPLRNARANANAAVVAAFLRDHAKVASVSYLGFLKAGTPARAVFDRQCTGAGSTFSFRIRGGESEAFAMLDRLQVFRMAVSLGGTESLICHSATTTHYSVPPEIRAEVGVDDATLRISVGIEHPDDLVADLASALDAIP
ncbi:cystathionine gamma-synthase/methionine-gamma-lyase [Angulomicrobium tetraedrale]|uniref:Cystathionine gamma-synthase/methionine-gamma-lyase n=1 Tax=Ancylobacter tetraedralis TaxID=217068 RepID=A0A839Z1U8_9HYPH|nr:cystathionine gamma-synthase family protein [Ancylobacter tetraedralis]MBB3769579.1 cystathionine gamma-synthase/methionine-gamma-lyase [Ancylobacter tetraedralis]